MTNHSKGEADEGSVGVDGEVGEDRAQGECQASKQETTSTEEDWSSISYHYHIFAPAQDGDDDESTRRANQTLKKCSKPTSYLSR